MQQVPRQVGDFQILNEVGSGSSAKIYLCQRISYNEKCCVKIQPKSTIQGPADQKHFEVELKLLQTLVHPNVVRYIDFQQDSENFYIFQEYCSGRNLLHFINATHGLTEKVAQIIFSQLVSVLYYLYSMQIAHRDLKPENLIVNDKLNLKVIDFGLASYCQTGHLLTTFCGSVHYAAPETLLRQPYNGNAADIWSSGVILYAMILGELPWDSNNMPLMVRKIVDAEFTIPGNVPRLIANLISMMIIADPKDRIKPENLIQYPWVKQEPGVQQRCSLPTIAGKGHLTPDLNKTSLFMNNNNSILHDPIKNPAIVVPSGDLIKRLSSPEINSNRRNVPSENILRKFSSQDVQQGQRGGMISPRSVLPSVNANSILNDNSYRPKMRQQFTQSFNTKGSHATGFSINDAIPNMGSVHIANLGNRGHGSQALTSSFACGVPSGNKGGQNKIPMRLTSILLDDSGEFRSPFE